jgi:sortase A
MSRVRWEASMSTSKRRTVRLEWCLWCAGAVGVAYCLMAVFQMVQAREVAAAINPVFVSAGPDSGASFLRAASRTGVGVRPEVVGRVEIPAIGLVTPLLAGDDSMSLTEGAGHIPGTAVPGGLGTVGIAGHRDTHFRLLRKVQPGMDVRLVGREGIYHYRVTSSEIVAPEQVSVLAIGQTPGLALVTCYPFRFIGHAPKRFVVHAALVSAAPDGPADAHGK